MKLSTLPARVRQLCAKAAQQLRRMTYAAGMQAVRLDYRNPHHRKQFFAALQQNTAEDAAAEQPLSAVAMVRSRTGLPGPGFYKQARDLACLKGKTPRAEETFALEQWTALVAQVRSARNAAAAKPPEQAPRQPSIPSPPTPVGTFFHSLNGAGLPLLGARGTGPWRFSIMATDKKETKAPEILERATQATMQRTRVHLNDLVMDTDRFCHRKAATLNEEGLKDLMDSLVLEGLQVPVEYFSDTRGRKVLVKGHRRVTACKLLAGRNTPGFKEDMDVEAIEVQGATPEDLLIRSVADNEIRLNLDRVSRIQVARKLADAGVQNERAARAMGISVKSYERDLLIARHGWMLQHVEDDDVPPTAAHELLSRAQEAGRLKELKEDLEIWVADKRKLIREKERMKKHKENKELRPSEKMIKRYLTKTLLVHWLELLKAKKRFDEDAKWQFAAGIERESGQLHVSAVKLDVNKAPAESLAKVASKFSQMAKELRPYIRRRYEQERVEGGPVGAEVLYDLDYLRELGLEDMAEQIEEQLEQDVAADGEEDAEHEQAEERSEEDLAEAVGELPAEMPAADQEAEDKDKKTDEEGNKA